MRGGCWVHHQGAGVTDVGQVRVQFQRVNECPRFILAAVNLEGENGTGGGVTEAFFDVLVWAGLQAGCS